MAPDGVLVVHRSADLQRWDEVAVLKTPYHVGDAKLAATDDELLVYTADSHHELEESGKERQVLHPYVWVSEDGYRWSEPTGVYDRNYWLWRVRVHDGVMYRNYKRPFSGSGQAVWVSSRPRLGWAGPMDETGCFRR